MQTRQQISREDPGSLQKKCVARFLYYFPGGFNDPKYIDSEYKLIWNTHLLWRKTLGRRKFCDLLNKGAYTQISSAALRIISKTNLLTVNEKKSLRDATKIEGGARLFAIGVYNYLYGQGSGSDHFHTFTRVLETLPHKQVSLLTWPLQTVFGFIARPLKYIVVLPEITIRAADRYGYPIHYRHRPDWDSYQDVLGFAASVIKDIRKLKPRDMIDMHLFFTVLGSQKYPDPGTVT